MATRGRPRHPDVLTPAEWQVLHAIRHGMSNRAIAERRGVSLHAVKQHVRHLREKLDVATRRDLTQVAGAPVDSLLANGGLAMDRATDLGPIGQIALTVENIDQAEAFYRDVLRLPHLFTFGTLAFFDCAGTRLFLTAATDEAHQRNHSVIYFAVADIRAAAADLAERGVTFLGAPHLIHRHDDGTEEWMAFFEDGQGNTLALMSRVGAG